MSFVRIINHNSEIALRRQKIRPFFFLTIKSDLIQSDYIRSKARFALNSVDSKKKLTKVSFYLLKICVHIGIEFTIFFF